MIDKFNSKDIRGDLVVLAREEGGEWFKLLEKKNALVTNAKKVISRALAGETGWKIDSIKAIKAGNTLATGLATYTYPSDDKVKFETIFSLGSFNDTIDEVRLCSTTGGDFSMIFGISINKPNTLELSIQWQLTII